MAKQTPGVEMTFGKLARRGLTVALAATLWLSTPRADGAPTASPAPDPAAIVADAAGSLAAERSGVVVLHRHIAGQQHAPGHDATFDEQSGVLRDGDRVVAVRVYSRTSNGVGDELAKAQADADKNLPDDTFQLPLREDRLAEYKFENEPCDTCPAGSVAVRFTSLKRDETHGDGVAVVDTASHHFLRLDFVPSILPKYVDKALISVIFGRALPDLWDVLEMDQQYSGHFLFLKGGADITTTLGNYRRFKSRDDGQSALDSGV